MPRCNCVREVMNKSWMTRIVNTAGRPCPLMQKKCPGSEKGCSFWIVEQITDGIAEDIQAGCLLAFEYVIANATRLESVRTQATMDKVSNSITNAAAFLSARAHPRLIDDNGD